MDLDNSKTFSYKLWSYVPLHMIIQLEKELQGDDDDSYCLNVIAQETRLLLAGVKGQKRALPHSSLSYNLVDPNMKVIWGGSEINGVKSVSNKQIKRRLYVLGKFISNLKTSFATKTPTWEVCLQQITDSEWKRVEKAILRNCWEGG